MELELARVEYHRRVVEAEHRNSLRRWANERAGRSRARGRRGTETGQPDERPARIDWPVLSIRLGPFQLALLHTVRIPAGRRGPDSHGTSSLLPG